MSPPPYDAAGVAASVSAASDITVSLPAVSPSRQMLLLVMGFEDVLASSGPWADIDGDSTHVGTLSGYQRVCFQPPDVDGGVGLEAWAAIWTSGSSPIKVLFGGTESCVAQFVTYSGTYDPGDSQPNVVSEGIIRASTKQSVDGDDPACPSIYAFVGERLIGIGADQLVSPGWGTPTPAGWSSRVDSARGGAHGNVEITVADLGVTSEGNSGAIPFVATAASGGHGATATLAIRPDSSMPAETSPLIAVEFAVAD